MNMIISVTEKDIVAGSRGSSISCPIALALKRCGLKDVHAYTTHILVTKGKEEFSSVPSRKVLQFINKFDRGLTVKPFRFTLSIP